MLVTVANRKGGVGKTTTSVFLASALAAATGAPCTVIDADPQASAAHWARAAARAGRPLTVPVVAEVGSRLGVRLPATPHIVIDTPPGDSDVTAAAIALADLVLVPTSASTLDLSQVRATVDSATTAGKPAVVLLTRTRRTRSVGAAEESLRRDGLRVLTTHIPLREALALAFGQPVRELHGYDLATAELLGLLPEQPYSVEAVRRRAAHTVAFPAPSLAASHEMLVPRVGLGRHRSTQDELAADAINLIDDELIQRLKSSMARLAGQK